MTKFRIDIEDYGCSGDTFLAAREVLFQERPLYAILENAITAPWELMTEYITGRVVLKSCDSKKAVQEIKLSPKRKSLSLYGTRTNNKFLCIEYPRCLEFVLDQPFKVMKHPPVANQCKKWNGPPRLKRKTPVARSRK